MKNLESRGEKSNNFGAFGPHKAKAKTREGSMVPVVSPRDTAKAYVRYLGT